LSAAGVFAGATTKRFIPNKSAEQVGENQRDIYAKTGMTPQDQVRASLHDPAIMAEVLAPRTPSGEHATPLLTSQAPPEPKPYSEPKPLPPDKTPPAQTIALTKPPGEPTGEPTAGQPPPAATATPASEQAPQRAAQEAQTTLAVEDRSDEAKGLGWGKFAENPVGMIVHHTGGRGSVSSVINTFEQRQLGSQFVIDRDGKISQILPDGVMGRHMMTGWGEKGQGLSNANMEGVEIIANDDADVLPVQVRAAEQLIKARAAKWGYNPTTSVFGHGEVNPGHKQATEGMTVVNAMRAQSQHQLASDTPSPAAAGHLSAPTPDAVTDQHLTIFRTLEGNADGHADHAVSSAGAVGRNQVMPSTARQYGFDGSRLQDTSYNDMVAKHIISDLSRKFDGNLTDMLVAYNGGEGRARGWIAGGRNMGDLPVETQHYIEHAERAGFLNGNYNWAQGRRQLTVQGDNGKWAPPEGQSPEPREGPYMDFRDSELARREPPLLRELQPPGDGGGREPPRLPPDDSITPPQPGDRRVEGWQLNDDMLLDKMSDLVGEKPERTGWNARKILGSFQSELAPARTIDREIGLAAGHKELGIEDQFRQVLASQSRAETFINHGVLRIDGERFTQINDTSWKSALDKVRENEGTVKGFIEYMMARRTVEKHEQSIQTGNELPFALQVASRDSIISKYEPAAEILRTVHDGVIDYARDSGRFSPEQATAMKDLNRYYITYSRIVDPSYTPAPYRRGFQTGANPKKMVGTETARQVIDPLTATLSNIQYLVSEADRNRAIGNVIHYLEGRQNLKPGEPDQRLLWHDRTEGSPSRPNDLFDSEGKSIPPEVSENLKPMLATRASKLGPNEFAFYRDGQREIWHAATPEMAQLMSRPVNVNTDFPLTTFAQWFARNQRLWLTSAPSFIGSVMIHGQLATSALAEGGRKIPFMDMMKGLVDAWSGNRFYNPEGTPKAGYKEALAHGAISGALTHMDQTQFTRFVRNEMSGILGENSFKDAIENGQYFRAGTIPINAALDYVFNGIQKTGEIFDRTGTTEAVTNVFRHPIEALRAFHDLVDSASRIGAMQRLENQGYSTLKAATLSRTAYLDHAEGRADATLRWWASTTPFMEVGFKDMDQVTQAWQRSPATLIMGAGTVMTLPSLVLYAVNWLRDQELEADDPTRYDQLPPAIRHAYFHIPTGGAGATFLRVRKPYVGGWLFSTLPELLLDSVAMQDKPTMTDWASSFFEQVVPPFMPTLLTPLMEHATNFNFHTGRPLVSASLESRLNYMQYTPNTTEAAKALSRLLGPIGLDWGNVSPVVLDEYLNQWTGGLFLQSLKAVGREFKPEGIGPAEGIEKNPFVASFFSRTRTDPATIERFYDEAAYFDKTHASVHAAIRDGDMDEVNDRITLDAGLRIDKIKKAISQQRLYLDQTVNQDPTMTNDEKIKETDQVASQMIAFARMGLDMMKEMRAQEP
jgi:hypothetical protein